MAEKRVEGEVLSVRFEPLRGGSVMVLVGDPAAAHTDEDWYLLNNLHEIIIDGRPSTPSGVARWLSLNVGGYATGGRPRAVLTVDPDMDVPVRWAEFWAAE